jgi:hypothetical protein
MDGIKKPFFVQHSWITVIGTYLLKNGAIITRDIKKVPTGTNMTMMHSGGAIIEYVEFNEEWRDE